MAAAIPIALLATSLLAAGSQAQAGKAAANEAELSAQTAELAATQREGDRKSRLAEAMATANAQAGAAGIRAFEGSPLTILQQSIENEQTATERDAFNTRISAFTTRARGRSARTGSQLQAGSSLIRGTSRSDQLMPE